MSVPPSYSLAGLVRFEFDSSSTSDMRVRTVLLFQLAKELKLLSDIFKLSIVVVNQVSYLVHATYLLLLLLLYALS